MYIYKVIHVDGVVAVDAVSVQVMGDDSLVFKGESEDVIRSFATGQWRECVRLAELPRRENASAAAVPAEKKPWIEHSSIEEWRRATAGR